MRARNYSCASCSALSEERTDLATPAGFRVLWVGPESGLKTGAAFFCEECPDPPDSSREPS